MLIFDQNFGEDQKHGLHQDLVLFAAEFRCGTFINQ